MKVIALVGSRRSAVEAESARVDAVVAQGHEAGGHTGRTSTMVLVPQIVDAVRIPVIAAEGIADGRGLAAALMLGASGALIGTRLLATPEARTAETHKRRLVEMQEDETIVSRCYTGKPSRVIRNEFVESWKGREAEILPMPAQWERVAPVVIPAKRRGALKSQIGRPANAPCSCTTSRRRARWCARWRMTPKGFVGALQVTAIERTPTRTRGKKDTRI
jgi:NAD(P)H-dependent flavin oxidoreductase YrpB (nitropropane dioxygenase family)